MAKNYKEAPWWWYVSLLIGSFILGLVVVIKENITLPVWAYVVSLIVGSIIAPVVSNPDCSYTEAVLTVLSLEHSTLLSLRKRYRHQQPFKDVGGSYAAWKTCW